MESKFRITFDTELDPSINVHLEDGTRVVIKQCGGGMYYYSMTNKAFDEGQTMDYNFLSTVEGKTSYFH